MDRASWHLRVRVRLGGAVLALMMSGAGGMAWSAPPPSRDSLEQAAALVRSRDADGASAMLRRILAADPSNRRAREILAFALETSGALAEERQVRAALAADYPGDARIVADYGRVLERSGDPGGALRAYRSAQALSPGGGMPGLDAAIVRMSGRMAAEVGTPVTLLSDPDASSSRLQAGVTFPLSSRAQLGLLGSHETARARLGPAASTSDRVTVSFVDRPGPGADWSAAWHLLLTSPRGRPRRDLGMGGNVAGRAALGTWLAVDGRAELNAPWDEAAVAVLHGGRTTGAEAHLYAHPRNRRILLQAGGLRRRISIDGAPSTRRAPAWQLLGVAGVDAVLWRRPANTVRGEMLDERLIAPTAMSPAVTLAYRHYEVSTRPTPEFSARIGLVPRASVDEGSIVARLVQGGGHAGIELRAGLGRDAARSTRAWRAGGDVIWAPTPTTRLRLGYEEATELVAGLTGRRHTSWMSFHADL